MCIEIKSFLIVPHMKTPNILMFLFYIAWDVIWLWCIKYCPEETHAYSQVFGLLNGLCEVVVNKEIKGLVQRSVKSCSQRKNYNKLTTFDRKKADSHTRTISISILKKNWQNKGKWSILYFITFLLQCKCENLKCWMACILADFDIFKTFTSYFLNIQFKNHHSYIYKPKIKL